MYMNKYVLISLTLVLPIVKSWGQDSGRSVNIRSVDSANKSLQMRPKELKEIVVSSSTRYITQTADKMIINVAQSPLATGDNIYNTLLRIPGVLEQSNSLNYNGKAVTVLINGRVTGLSGEELKNMLINMLTTGVDKIEVIANPSSKYDAQGGSVINIRLIKNQQFGTNGTFTLGVGSGRFGRYNTGISLNYRYKAINIYGGFDYAYNKQYYDNYSYRPLDATTSISEHEYDIRTRNNYSYKWGFDYDIDKKNSFGVLLRGFVNFRDRVVNNESIISKGTGKDSSSIVLTNGYARFLNNSINFYYKRNFDSTGKELIINGDYLNYKKTWGDDFATHFFDDGGKEYIVPFILHDQSPANNNIRSITIDYTHPVKRGKWELGLKTIFTTTDNDILWQQQLTTGWQTDIGKTNHFIYNENINAAYVNFIKAMKKHNFQLGLRAEQTNTKGESITLNQTDKNSYFNLFPNLGVQFTLPKKRQIGFNYRKSIQRFGFDYVNPFVIYRSQYAYSQGNPDIKPMIMHNFELSYSCQYRFFVRAGYSRIIKVLGPTYQKDLSTGAVISSYGNLRSADLYTATVTYVMNLMKGRWMSTNTTGGFYARYGVAPGNFRQYNERVTGFFSTNNALVLAKKLKAELTGFYYSPIASGVYQQQSIFSANIGLTESIMKGKGTLSLSITDVFNTLRIKNNVLYQDVNIHYDNKSESRFVNLVFTYRFGNSKVRAGKVRKTGIEDEKNRLGSN